MQAILKLIQAFLWAWQYAKENPRKSIAAGVGVGATSMALMSGVSGPYPTFHAGNITNEPGSNGQVFESNGDGTYTFGTDDGGVGGGATELSGLDDVADTLTGNSGEFIGWAGTEWDDLTISLDTLSDTTITAAATGEVIRYNGSAWVDSALSVDDLSEVTITSLAAGEILRYNGSALVDTTLSIDDLTEVTITTPADDQFLRYNGSGWVNETVSVSVDATGITDGYVYTADGDATPAWEAPAVGGLLTPDGVTAITRSTRFNVKDYGASGIGRKYYAKWTTSVGTTTVSTRDSADSAKNHLLGVGNGVALIGAGPVCSVSTPAVTGVNASVTLVGAAITFTANTGTDVITSSAELPLATGDAVRFTTTTTLPAGLSLATTYYLREATTTTYTVYDTSAHAITGGATGLIDITTTGTGTHTVVGYTEHNYTFVAFDGNGGYTTASSAVQSFGWNLPAGWTAHYRTVTGPIPYGAAAMAIFGRGTSSRQCLVHLDVVTPFGSGATDNWPETFTGITDLGAGSCRLDGVENIPPHGIAVNDYINIKARTTGDTWADGRFLVTAVDTGAGTITFSGATFGSTAAGRFRRGTFAWNDQGDLPPLHASKYLPDVEGPVLKWRASCRVWQGQRMYDTVGARWWRAERVVGTAMTGTTEPTWTALETTKFVDGEVTWVRDWLDSPVNEPSASVNQTLLTEVATVPTSSTFTTVDAATADNATNGLLCSHNDALASRECLAAAKTYGQPATIEYPAGEYIHILPKQTNTTYWNYTETAYTIDDHFLLLNAGRDLAMPSISIVADPNANIRVRMMQSGRLIEDLGGDATNQRHVGNNNFITVGTDETLVRGGMWEWAPAQCGFTQKDFTSVSYGQTGNWLGYMQLGDSATLGTRPERVTWDGVEVHWPTIATGLSGITGGDSQRTSKLSMYNCKLFYGGGDGDQTFLPWGDFVFQGGWVENDRRYGSHGFYLGVSNNSYKVQDCTIKGTVKNSIQIRGQGGDTWISNIGISGVTFLDSGPLLVGDQTSSNRAHRVTISDCLGTGVDVRLAEARNVTISGGVYGSITAPEDCKGVKIQNLFADTIDLTSSDMNYDIDVTNCTFNTELLVANCENVRVSGCRTRNPFTKSTILNSGVYEWIATGSNSEYYCRLRSTGGDPGISSPTGVLVRDNATIAAGTLGALGGDAWFYGYPDGLAGAGIPYQTVVVKMGDSNRYDPDANPYGSVRLITVGTAEVGMLVNSTLNKVTFEDCQLTSTWTATHHLVGYAFAGASLTDVTFEDITTEYTGLTYNQSFTWYAWDFGNSTLAVANRVKIKDCKWLFPLRSPASIGADCRMLVDRGGDVTLEGLDLPTFGSGWNFVSSNAAGVVNVINCRVQTNRATYTVDATGNTFTLIASGNAVDYFDTDGQPVMVDISPGTAIPVTSPQIATNVVYWYRNANSKLYASASDASTDTSAIDVTTANGPVTIRTLDASRLALLSTHEFLGDTTEFNVYGMCRDNTWRGSDSATYAQIASNQSNYVLIPLLNKHRLSSDASREIDGFDAPGAGSVSRRVQLMNVGAQAIVLKDDTDTDSVAQNRIACHTNADITLAAGETIELEYDVISQLWRTIFN